MGSCPGRSEPRSPPTRRSARPPRPDDLRPPAYRHPGADEVPRDAPASLLALQRAIGNAATARLARQGGRGHRGEVEGREDARDRQTKRGHEDDERRGRPAGGRDRRGRRSDPTSDFESDWAGRAILMRYLFGEGDWDIRDDPDWTEYMKNSAILRKQVRDHLTEKVRREAEKDRKGRSAAEVEVARARGNRYPFVETFHGEMENGEGVVGYQYLHGTNKDVGDFEIVGWAEFLPDYGPSADPTGKNADLGTTVKLDVTFVWNDMIDPNPQYQTDSIKSWIAEIITLGEAEAYRISIGWREEVTVRVEGNGNTTITGYPAD
jgi:hypothetical protein